MVTPRVRKVEYCGREMDSGQAYILHKPWCFRTPAGRHQCKKERHGRNHECHCGLKWKS